LDADAGEAGLFQLCGERRGGADGPSIGGHGDGEAQAADFANDIEDLRMHGGLSPDEQDGAKTELAGAAGAAEDFREGQVRRWAVGRGGPVADGAAAVAILGDVEVSGLEAAKRIRGMARRDLVALALKQEEVGIVGELDGRGRGGASGEAEDPVAISRDLPRVGNLAFGTEDRGVGDGNHRCNWVA